MERAEHETRSKRSTHPSKRASSVAANRSHPRRFKVQSRGLGFSGSELNPQEHAEPDGGQTAQDGDRMNETFINSAMPSAARPVTCCHLVGPWDYSREYSQRCDNGRSETEGSDCG